MTPSYVTEDMVEQEALSLLENLGYNTLHGPDIAPDEPNSERSGYDQILLIGRLRTALVRINPQIPAASLERIVDRLSRPETPDLLANNRKFHEYLTTGMAIDYQVNGQQKSDRVQLIDWDNPDNNEFLAVNQYTVVQDEHQRRPDIVIFVNGLPLSVIELKNPTDPNATVDSAFSQLQTYKSEISDLFIYNELLVISDGIDASVGSLFATMDWFKPWKTIDGDFEADTATPQLEVLLKGMFDRRRLLDIIRYFIVFHEERAGAVKKIAGYHQYHAVNKAIERTIESTSEEGDRKAGVVWHTQGSGKSLTMVFYTAKISRQPVMGTPTIVMLTDRTDLDDQLFDDVFSGCRDLLRDTPVQANSRADLQKLLSRETGGIIFTTVGKVFPRSEDDRMPELSARRNIVVLADEAHRSQYNFISGFAKHIRDALPNASFIGFTGTPIDSDDRNTQAIFGDYIDVYDIQRAVEDKSTIPIYYESRLAKIGLDADEIATVDEEIEEVLEDEEQESRERTKTKWSAIEKLVGAEDRIEIVAKDIVDHWDARTEVMPEGKAMIVCMSRRICVELYEAIKKLRPEWHDERDDSGIMKVVMTGSATDPVEWQQHIRNKPNRKALATRFKDPEDNFKIVLVRDMWLTGFDCPALNTMYADKPMKGHGLMQAIARVNRVFRDKPGGLVVDYFGLGYELKKALKSYRDGGGTGTTKIDQSEAVAVMKDKLEVVRDMFHGFDLVGAITADRLNRVAKIIAGAEHILEGDTSEETPIDDRKKRFLRESEALKRAHTLSVPHPEALANAEELAYILSIRGRLQKIGTTTVGLSATDVDTALSQLVSKAVIPEGIVDIFKEAGIQTPDISILSDEFLQEVQKTEHRNYAAEALQRLLQDEIKIRTRKNTVQGRKFSELLESSLLRYHNRTIEATQVILELIDLAKQMREASMRGDSLGLSEDEMAFFDALATNDSAVEVMGDDQLKVITLDLVDTVRRNATIDWTAKESVKANLRRMIRRTLRKYGYPPDLQDEAVQTVLRQAEQMAKAV